MVLVEVGDETGRMVDAVDKVVDDAEINTFSFENTGVFFLKTGNNSLGSRVKLVAGSRVDPNELV